MSRLSVRNLVADLRKRLAPVASGAGSVYSFVADRVHPWFGTVTSIGWGVLLLGALAWVAATALGWIEASVVAMAALFLVIGAAFFMIGRTRLAVATVVEPPRVAVGQALTGELRARNEARGPLVSTSLEFPIGAGGVTYDLPMLLPGAEHTELFVVPTQRRGVIDVGPVRTVRGDPLGLFRRVQEWTDRTEVFVHPRTTHLEPFGVGLVRDLEGSTAQNTSMSDLAFHALREYVPGDDLRHIHWRSSARHGQLLVRQFLDTRRSHIVVIVDSSPMSYDSEDEYETAMSIAGSLLRRGILDEFDVSFATGDVLMVRATAANGGGRTALDACSRAKPQQTNLIEITAEAARQAPDASLVMLVTGRYPEFVALQRAAGQFSVDATTVAVRVDSSQRAGFKAVADLPMITLPDLDQLPIVLSKGLSG